MSSVPNEEKVPFPVHEEDPLHVQHDDSERGHPKDMLCGFGPFRPDWLQPCSRIGVFAGVYSVIGLMTSLLSVYIISQITTIEKHFGLSSAQSGFLLSCNDIGFLLTTMLASYSARRVHIPRVLYASTVLYGIGGLICSIAYFVSKDVFKTTVTVEEQEKETMTGHFSEIVVEQTSTDSLLCNINSYTTHNSSECMADDTKFSIGLPNRYSTIAMALIAVGMIIQGISKAPRYPFLVTYVDDNGKKKNTAMYMGIVTGVGFFGPALGFAVGGVFSQIYITLEDVSISPRHPAWLGAWWLGFIVFGLISVVVAFPLICFPRRMKPKTDPDVTMATNYKSGSRKKSYIYASGFVTTMLRLLKNRVYVLLMFAQTLTIFAVASMVAFSAKYMETQFFLPVWKANMLMGAAAVVSASLGSLIGGLVITKRRLTPLQCIKLMLTLGVICTVLISFGYFLGCSNADIVGLNSGADRYFPVCGSDGRNYFSPCVAGCSSESEEVYTECGCLGQNATAVPGLCETECNMLVPYLLVFVLANLLGTMGIIPSVIVSIRCVSEKDKSMAVGFISLMSTAFGWLLGPVLFGRFIDTTCLIWTTSCDSRGACALYDNDRLRVVKISFEIVPKISVCILTVLMYLAARHKTDWSSDNAGTDTDSQEMEDVEKELKAAL